MEGHIKRLYGVYRATVDDNKDPQHLRRLKVKVQSTSFSKDATTNWIWPMISTKRPPAIGAGVYVMYVGGDPEYPVWIGEFSKEPQGVLSYGSFLSTIDQSAVINTAKAVTLNTTSISSGVKLENSTKMVVDETGTYNLQFSAQIHNTGGGGSGETVYIWLKKNGVNIDNSSTAIVTKANEYTVMTVNVYEKMNYNDYFEIYWVTDNANIRLESVPAGNGRPAVPSIIATVNQVA